MSELYAALVRHGDYFQLDGAPSAWQPFQLTDTGLEQSVSGANEIMELAQKNDWDLIPEVDSSILLRAWQTAEVFVKEVKEFQFITSFEALCERCVGSAANLTVDQIEIALKADPRYENPPGKWKSDSYYSLPYPGAESLMEAGERVAHHLDTRMSELSETVSKSSLKIFVGHGAAIRHAAYQLGAMEFDDIAKLSMYHARPVILKYSSDGPWEHVAGDWKVRTAKSECKD